MFNFPSIGSVRSAEYDHSTQLRSSSCNTVLAGVPRTITDGVQQVLNTAARVVSGTRKFDRGLSHLPKSELEIPRRVQYKLGVTVHRCLQNKASQY